MFGIQDLEMMKFDSCLPFVFSFSPNNMYFPYGFISSIKSESIFQHPSCSYNATELLDKLNNLEKRLTRLQYIQAEVKTQSKKMKEIKDRVTG